jgi:hypothetical protein
VELNAVYAAGRTAKAAARLFTDFLNPGAAMYRS